MKPFHAWIESMANSIEDASIIVKDEHGNLILPTAKSEPKINIYDDLYEGWQGRMDSPDQSYYDYDDN